MRFDIRLAHLPELVGETVIFQRNQLVMVDESAALAVHSGYAFVLEQTFHNVAFVDDFVKSILNQMTTLRSPLNVRSMLAYLAVLFQDRTTSPKQSIVQSSIEAFLFRKLSYDLLAFLG